MDLWQILVYIGYCVLGFFMLRLIFWELPLVMGANSWPNYLKKIGVGIIIIGALFGFGYLAETYPSSTFVLILIVSVFLIGIMVASSNRSSKHDD